MAGIANTNVLTDSTYISSFGGALLQLALEAPCGNFEWKS
jgi:hypothetical protein